MKKLLVVLFGLASFLFADMDVRGVITKIDNTAKTIVVNDNTIIKVEPYTQIEKDVDFGWDVALKFSDLKVGQFVEVDVNYQNANVLIAEDIEVKDGQRAY